MTNGERRGAKDVRAEKTTLNVQHPTRLRLGRAPPWRAPNDVTCLRHSTAWQARRRDMGYDLPRETDIGLPVFIDS